ncbi:uncharacterized protein LOC122952732 [Acropora millepora]|uniref:uncharacterized protein LOC122952732 n=1 Tax=Acropora millepora TaxID=45264 RepID=UPI001CF4C05D|nr:uncharacterized protein LOC122952732 [Acropora millepora]
MGKSRVAPLKPVTIPRLELTAAVVASKIGCILRKELECKEVKDTYWTDSKTVLGYINNDAKRFHVFVGNRVQEIRDKTSREQWRYIETKQNPADIASRGSSVQELIEQSFVVRKPSSVLEHLEYFSSWHQAKRAVAVCLRLQEKFRSPNQKEVKRDPSDSRSSKYIPVNVQKLQNAGSEIIKIVQGAAFPEDIISMKKLKTSASKQW